MSFVRIGHGPSGMARKKKTMRNKAWDDTIHDLTAYKATPEEIAYRKSSHRSKHAISSRLMKHPGSAHKGKRSSPFRNNAQARKLAIMKEVLYDQQQDVLEKSDTMMSVVKDLFGDDPRRFAGFPKVTSAPNTDKEDAKSSLASKPPKINTRSEFLSDSVMDSSALNDLQESDSEDEASQAPISYQPKINMQRFQAFLEKEERNNTLSTISGQAGMSHLGQGAFSQMMGGAIQSSQLPDVSHGDGPPVTPTKKDLDDSIAILRPPGSAINDTKKVKKTKPRIPQPQPEHNTSNFSLPDLKKVLENLEEEIADYERQTGRRPMADRNRQESFSGYTLAIVDSVTKLTRYLKECELRLQAEMTVREQLAQDVMQFRALVDALTSDIITTQEEFGQMAAEFVKFRRETQEEIQRLKTGNVVPAADQTKEPSTVTPPRSQQVAPPAPPQQQRYQPQHHIPDPEIPNPRLPFGDHLKPVSSAVMLSPPVRRSRVVEPERDLGPDDNRQTSVLNMKDLMSGEESYGSNLQEDYADLPKSSLPFASHAGSSVPPRVDSVQQSASGRGLQTISVVHGQGGDVAGPQSSYIPSSKPLVPVQTMKPTFPAPVNTVNVPRPTPLVQSNVNIPMSTGASTGKEMNQSVPNSHDPLSLVPNSDRAFLASQIAELNKQHEEAQRRLENLMLQQKSKESQAQDRQSEHQPQIPLQLPEQDQNEQISWQGSQSQMANQLQNIELQQLQQLQQRQQLLQRQQQQKLLEMVQQQQQRIMEQQQQHQKVLLQQQQQQKSQPSLAQQTGSHSGMPEPVSSGQEPVRQSADFPGYRPQPKPTGLPAYPVSPNISPISQRSDRVVYQSVDSQNGSLMIPASRGITVSIPKVDMDLSGGSPSPKPVQVAR